MYYVYLLKLKDKSIYTGSTPDLKKRLKQHQKGFVESTKNLCPLKLVWYCAFRNQITSKEI
ncbi:hypothetical protein COY35_00850 [candidate division WWE3 bacterium CG_4_10_14_0_2_um_filter_47_8]|nr:MAG: hypothetical protein COY35_00850 [candidate division WWE3 bacterium CG_4_10_14_0_2_um_filter_47_8]